MATVKELKNTLSYFEDELETGLKIKIDMENPFKKLEIVEDIQCVK